MSVKAVIIVEDGCMLYKQMPHNDVPGKFKTKKVQTKTHQICLIEREMLLSQLPCGHPDKMALNALNLCCLYPVYKVS